MRKFMRPRGGYRFHDVPPKEPRPFPYYWHYAGVICPPEGSYVLTSFRHDPKPTPIITQFKHVKDFDNAPMFVLYETDEEVCFEDDMTEVMWCLMPENPVWRYN